MNRLLPIIFFSLLAGHIQAAGDFRSAGGRAASLGGCSVTAIDPWAPLNNPAATAWLGPFSAGISVTNRFLLKELSSFAFSATINTGAAGVFSLAATRFGFSLYNEVKVGLSYARHFGRRFAVGLLIDYQRYGLCEPYGSVNLASFDLGMIFLPANGLSVGLHLINPVPVKVVSFPEERLPVLLRLGFDYNYSGKLTLAVEGEKGIREPFVLRTGVEYRVARPAWIRIGLATTPLCFTFGIGIQAGGVTIDLASEYNQVLGFSPSLSLFWTFRKTQPKGDER